MNRVLSHTLTTGSPDPANWLYVLHGIYGSGRNWGSVARGLAERRPEWAVVLVDLRLHGGSVGFPPPHTLEACVADLVALEDDLARSPRAVIGHSFGGKVALHRAARGGLEQCWVVDSTLVVGEPAGTAWAVIDIVRSLPSKFDSRDQVAAAMAEHGYPSAVGHWLAMNLVRGEDGFRWKLDWSGVEQMLRDYFATDVWPILENPPTDLHIVKAADSGAIDGETESTLRAIGESTGRVHLHTVSGGHWVNTDNPEALLDLLAETLPA